MIAAFHNQQKSKNFELFIGSDFKVAGLAECVLPNGEYAKLIVKPKLGLLWGTAIGEAKSFFYRKWLPKNAYEALNMEYEYHTEKSIAKKTDNYDCFCY